MRRSAAFAVVVAVFSLACAKKEMKMTDSSASAAMAAPPKTVSVADFVGTWAVKVTNDAGDSTLTTYDLTATADTTPWTLKFANGQTVTAKIMGVSGDSIMIDAGPYPSVLRKGVQVTTHSVNRLMDGKLVGAFVAHYNVKTADSVRTGKIEGMKKP